MRVGDREETLRCEEVKKLIMESSEVGCSDSGGPPHEDSEYNWRYFWQGNNENP